MTTPAMSGPMDRNGTLPDGTEYRISVPANWDGLLINDLDAVGALVVKSPSVTYFLEHGYAYSGTGRRADRATNFDPRAERDQQVQVLDVFEIEFGPARCVIQLGCSGGGGVALGVAEAHPDRVDGAVSMNGVESVVISNIRLDLLFTLNALIAPNGDLPIVGINPDAGATAAERWRGALAAARTTELGRARMALAGALAQLPTWGAATAPYPDAPDPSDRAALQAATVRTVLDAAVYAVGTRPLYDSPAGVMSWNNGIDYRHFYDNADADQRELVEALYAEAGLAGPLAVRGDVDRVNAYPRIEADPAAFDYWQQRALTGDPQVPVLQLTTAGDATRSTAMLAAYAEGVQKHGKSELYRQALIHASGHCTGNVAEIASALETMVHRLETGSWDDSTNPEELNTLARSLELSDEPRFVSADDLPERANRAFFA
jgi:pimeloyl-ACP methyl ester carboxylesterase